MAGSDGYFEEEAHCFQRVNLDVFGGVRERDLKSGLSIESVAGIIRKLVPHHLSLFTNDFRENYCKTDFNQPRNNLNNYGL